MISLIGAACWLHHPGLEDGLYRFSLGLGLLISIWQVSTSAPDLLFGQPLLSDSIRQGNWAWSSSRYGTARQRWCRFRWWRFRLLFCFRQRHGASRAKFFRRFNTFFEALFKVTELAAGADNDLGSCQ